MSTKDPVQFTGGQMMKKPELSPSLTEWTKEPTIQILKEDLEASKPAHDTHVTNVQKWRDLLNATGQAAAPKVKGRSNVTPKLIRRQAEWRYSALSEPFLGSDKIFDVDPTTFEDTDAAKQNELVLNWQFRTKFNRVRFIDEFVRTNVDEGSAIVRLGWKRLTKTVKEKAPVWTYMAVEFQEDLMPLQQALELYQSNRRGYNESVPEEIKAAVDFYLETGQPSIAVQTGEEEVEVEKVIVNEPTLEIINPENVYVDPSCGGDLDKAGFVVISFETSQAELKKEPDRYKNLDYVDWEGATHLVEVDHASKTPQDFNFKDALRKRVVAYEYWGYHDIHDDGTLVPIVATWIGNTLIRMEENPFPDGKAPIVITNYMPKKRELMGETDAELLEDNQKILGALTRGMIDLLGRSANSQRGMPKGMLDPLNRRRYENGQDYDYNPNNNPQTAIVEHTYPEIPASAYNLVQLQNQEAEALTGVKSFAGGMSGEAYGDVAAGIRGVLDAASKREMAILRRLAKGLTDIGVKIMLMNQEFLSEEEVVRVTNREFVTVRREDLAGNFDLSVDISTAEVDNAKAQDLGFMLQTMGPNLGMEMVQLILSEIADLKRMPELAERIRRYQPQPDPLVVKEQELKIAKLEAEIAEIAARTEQLRADAEKKIAEAGKTMLDSIEQETGTKHERDLEKQRAQATGNQSLEVTKALLKSRKAEESRPNIEAAVGWNELSKMLPSSGRENPVNTQISPVGINPKVMTQIDPRLSLNSQYFEPSQDPALNQALRL